ncbi:hypothetical protein [Anoxybacteroides rupiense]|uniref:hypothetical protein n=1 Tax=Anoxybacteroides rupiense TaxID=311460 RepID=UPI003FA5ED1B
MNQHFDELTKERDGFVMRNEKNGVEIKCTEEFVEAWKKRGFEIIEEKKIRLLEE